MPKEDLKEYADVFSLIDEMYKVLSEAKSGFIDPNVVKVNKTELEGILGKLKDSLPTQLKSAVDIMKSADARMKRSRAESEDIVKKAKETAGKIIQDAEKRADYLAGSENVALIASKKAEIKIAEANQAAEAILGTAGQNAQSLTEGADQYCISRLQSLIESCQKIQSEAAAGIESLKSKQKRKNGKAGQ